MARIDKLEIDRDKFNDLLTQMAGLAGALRARCPQLEEELQEIRSGFWVLATGHRPEQVPFNGYQAKNDPNGAGIRDREYQEIAKPLACAAGACRSGNSEMALEFIRDAMAAHHRQEFGTELWGGEKK